MKIGTMHTLKAIRGKALHLMRELGVEHLGQPLQELGWTFEWDRAKRRMGACHTRKGGQEVKIISLSGPRAKKSGWSIMEDVAGHEIAHALDHKTWGKSDHGPAWKAWARKCGADPSRLYEGDDLEALPSKYVGRCPNECGFQTGFHRKVKRDYACVPCCDEHAGGKFDARFVLEIRQNY